MGLECLNVDLVFTILRLSQRTLDSPPLVDQAAPNLAHNNHLIVDLSGIDLTSMDIGELVNLADEFCKAWEGKACYMAVVNLTPAAQSIFSVTKLDRVFQCFDAVSNALDHFSKESPGELKVAQ